MKLLKNLVAVSAAISAIIGFVAFILVMAGFRPFILKTQSMEPIYTQGSLCWVDTRVSLDSLKVGDVACTVHFQAHHLFNAVHKGKMKVVIPD